HHLLHIDAAEILIGGLGNGTANEITSHLVGALHFTFVFEFQLSGDRRHGGVNVTDTWHDQLLVPMDRAALRILDHVFHAVDGEALAYARAVVHLLVLARAKCDPLNDLLHVLGNAKLITITLRPGFLRGDGNTFVNGRGIVGADLRTDPVF